MGDRQSVLRRDDSGVGGGDGLGPDEVLADPGQPGAAERWLVGADHRLEADVAGLGDQRTAQAGGELLDARMALADMGESVGKAGACGDLQHDVRQVDPRHPGRDGRLQGDEAGRPLDLVERAQHQLVPAVSALDPGSRIAWAGWQRPGARRGPASGSEIAHLRLGIRRPVEGAADGQACGVPCFAAQQAAPGIGVAYAGRDEHVAPLQPGPETFEGGEDVGAVVDDATGAHRGRGASRRNR